MPFFTFFSYKLFLINSTLFDQRFSASISTNSRKKHIKYPAFNPCQRAKKKRTPREEMVLDLRKIKPLKTYIFAHKLVFMLHDPMMSFREVASSKRSYFK